MLRSQKNYSVKTRIILKGKNTVIKLRFKFAKWRKKKLFWNKNKKKYIEIKSIIYIAFFFKVYKNVCKCFLHIHIYKYKYEFFSKYLFF